MVRGLCADLHWRLSMSVYFSKTYNFYKLTVLCLSAGIACGGSEDKTANFDRNAAHDGSMEDSGVDSDLDVPGESPPGAPETSVPLVDPCEGKRLRDTDRDRPHTSEDYFIVGDKCVLASARFTSFDGAYENDAFGDYFYEIGEALSVTPRPDTRFTPVRYHCTGPMPEGLSCNTQTGELSGTYRGEPHISDIRYLMELDSGEYIFTYVTVGHFASRLRDADLQNTTFFWDINIPSFISNRPAGFCMQTTPTQLLCSQYTRMAFSLLQRSTRRFPLLT